MITINLEAPFGKVYIQTSMNFEEEFCQGASLEPSLPTIIQEDKISMSDSKTIKFQVLVKFFNRFSNMRGVKKGNYMKQFLKILFKADRSPGFVYPIIRLLLPGDDKDRGNYGLKQKNLAKVIADSLNLAKESYLRLHHYKNPSFQKDGIGIGDFSLCVQDVVKNFCKEHSSITISELNNLLDDLVRSSKEQVNTFRKLFSVCTAQEIKWIIRIILKDLKINVKMDNILKAYHPDAQDYFNLTNSLIQTCKKFQNPSVSLDDDIKIFFPIRPMLAGKKKINYFSENREKVYYVQTKFDGQRLQAHKKGDEIKLFSRNAVDYSKLYQEFVEVIRSHIDADECILDGEIIVIQKDGHKMVPFGMNKVVALDKDNSYQRLCYKIFDILWLKEQDEDINLMKYQLRQRKQILQKIVKNQPGVIELVKYEELSDYDDILRRFSQSIDNNEEGIMLKQPHSIYVPKERGSSWIKLKGDYVDGLTDTLDLVILGGYFGDSTARYGPSKHWSDQITSFLLGVIDRIDPLNSNIAYAIPFAKVGTGYSMEELNILRNRLRDNLSKNESKFKPAYMDCKWKPSLQDRPDCWITQFSKSIILEVKAAEMIISESYPTGYTLRFPRVVKIRYDKDWNEAQTLKDIEELSNAAMYSKNLKRKLDDSDSDGQKGQKVAEVDGKPQKKVKKDKQERKDGVYQDYLGYDMINDKIESHLFHGFEFCVFFLNPYSKYDKHHVEKDIMTHDGGVVQNPLPSTQYIVTDNIDYKLRAYQSKNKRYIFIKPQYIVNCISANKILNLSPLYLTVLPEGNAKFYMQNFDRFGDSYTDFLDLRELNNILDHMKGQYSINEKLMDRIALNKRRKGKVSICFGVTELEKVKLKMNDNVIVSSFEQRPNTVIVNGEILPYEKAAIKKYQDQGNDLMIEYVDELIAIDLL